MALLTELTTSLWDSLLFWITNPTKFVLPVTMESLSVYNLLTWIFIMSCLFCLVMFELTNNLSQVDRLWSILPPIYSSVITCWCIAEKGYGSSSAMILMSFLTVVWGGRLTFQFFMKDGYTLAGEDYRWVYVRQVLGDNWLVMQLFNLFFVVIYQNILLFLLIVPQLVMIGQPTHISAADCVIGFTYLTLVVMEAIADTQQQSFQRRKHKAISEGAERAGDLKAGFLRSGLFSYCRHPNFVCEILLWWVFALFPVPRVGLGWFLVGAANLTALFSGSQELTEQISAKKYPQYTEYQRTVPAYIPSVRMMSV